MELIYMDEETFVDMNYTEKPLAKGEYENCTFQNCNFSNSDLSEIIFIECEFIDCNLSNAILNLVSLQDVYFKNCKLIGLFFDKCNNFGFAVSFENCQLNYSIFYQMNLKGCSFSHSLLHNVDFAEANLTDVNFNQCDLLNALFDHSNLEHVDFRTSFNYSIDPDINMVMGAKFSLPEVLGLLDKYHIIID